MAESVLYHVSRMSSEHSDWRRGIEFYRQEMEILKKRLAEVSQKYTRTEVKAEVEHFQNQFIVQRNNLDDLKHAIGVHERHLNQDAGQLDNHIANSTLAEHDELRDRFADLEKTINDLRHEFNRFLARYM